MRESITFVPKINLRHFICLKQMDRMCWTIQTDSDNLFFLTEPDVELFMNLTL